MNTTNKENKTKRSTKILATLALITTIGFVSVIAQDSNNSDGFCKSRMGMMKHLKHKKQHFRKIMAQLDLSDAQKKSLKAQRVEMRKSMRAERMKRDHSHNIAPFISVDGVDRKAMMDEHNKRMESRVNFRADKMEKLLEVLTPEQRKKFISLLKVEKN